MAVSVHLLVLSTLIVVLARDVLGGEWPYSNGSGHHGGNHEELQGYTNAVLNVTYNDSTGNWHSDKQEQGRFGRGHVGQASGVLVHLGKHKAGCTSVDRPVLPQGEAWIALVERGGCLDDLKVENAWASNAAAVVIYNARDSAPLEKMDLHERRNISGVLIPRHRGEELVRLVENGTRVYLTITVGSFVQKPYTNINRTSVLFVSISFIVLMIISLAWLVFYYVQRFRYIHAKDRLSRRLCSAAKKALSKIPTKNIKSEDKEIQGDGECCAVCIEPYKVSDVLRILPCKHEFHRSCIDPWLLEHRTCPMCKMDILKHYGFVFTGSQESILHMDIEEVFGIGTEETPDTDSLQRRSISPMPHIRPVEHQQASSPTSPELQSQSSRASSPDEMSPSLSSGKCLMRGGENSTDPVPCVLVCSSCGSDMAAQAETVCDIVTCSKDNPCDMEDGEADNCSSISTASPQLSRSLTK